MNYKIGIDVDGVLRDFCDAVTRVVKRDFPHYIKDDFTEIDDWRLANCFNCEKEDLQSIYWHSHAEEIMGNANPMYGSIKKMYDLFEWADKKGHSLSCVTSQKPHARFILEEVMKSLMFRLIIWLMTLPITLIIGLKREGCKRDLY